MKTYYSHNGKIFEIIDPAISASNHGYRYGDGLFETMKMKNGRMPLFDDHVERLFNGMEILGFTVPGSFTKQNMEDEIIALATKNNCVKLARIRLTVVRGNGGINDCDDKLQYTIECMQADNAIDRLNENGFSIDIFPDSVKSCDKFSNLKTTSYLSYVMAAQFAKNNKLNDALIFNQHSRICESSIANIFWINKKSIYTPPLSECCVAGVMRKFLLDKISIAGYQTSEKELTEEILFNADEVFLTNAVYGIRWVKQFKDKLYTGNLINNIYQSILSPLWK